MDKSWTAFGRAVCTNWKRDGLKMAQERPMQTQNQFPVARDGTWDNIPRRHQDPLGRPGAGSTRKAAVVGDPAAAVGRGCGGGQPLDALEGV